ncbi:MAG TPA: hypothetical protein VFB72_04685 [Verrucomicrobiae bacterium]|nr:hypothetical protein [Verrucomicrobiae bacterium]
MSDKQNIPISPGPTQTETLLGGKTDVAVCGSDGGFYNVFVRQLPIKSFPALLAVQDDELKMAELYCDKAAGWAETLSLESLEKVVTEGERLNQDFFSRWVQRRLNRQEKLMPGVTEKLVRAASASPNGSQKAASSAA